MNPSFSPRKLLVVSTSEVGTLEQQKWELGLRQSGAGGCLVQAGMDHTYLAAKTILVPSGKLT